VKVVDFGLVKKVDKQADANLSVANAIMGTPLYLAPEAITSPDALDARGDLYALGAVGYFLVTGKPVFSGSGILQVLTRTLNDAIESPSQRLGKPVPAKLEAILMQCLSRHPEDRPVDATEVREALLACDDVEPWTTAAAKDWWASARADAVAARAAKKKEDEEVSPFDATLTIAPRDGAGGAAAAE